MDLGTFSVSLNVQSIARSKEFYRRLGFEVIAGNEKENWLILNHGKAYVGIFQGMFERNIMTFNPTDARAIQRELKNRGIRILEEADESTTGPTHLRLEDPDGNPILIDQH